MDKACHMIKKYRTEHNFTQASLAKEIGISAQKMSAYEVGRYRLPADIFLAIITEGFKTTPQNFFDFVISENETNVI